MIVAAWLACAAAPEATPAPAPEPVPAAPVPAPDVPVVPGPELVGLCDASAAVAVGRWLVVADDEHDVLRVFDTAAALAPAAPIVLGKLATAAFGDGVESDVEGMAVAADGTVWVTASHDAGNDPERLPHRQRLFRLAFAEGAEGVTASLAGGPSAELIEKGAGSNQLRGIVENTVGKSSTDPNGLSIEGLATGPAGSLLFGFRNPVHSGRSLVVRLDDPTAFLGGAEPTFTGPRWLKLGGAGIRSLEAEGDGFLVVSGPSGEGDGFAVWRWSGFDDGSLPERLPVAFGDFQPEALVRVGEAWWVLSDDGTRPVGTRICKDLPETDRRARTARLPPLG